MGNLVVSGARERWLRLVDERIFRLAWWALYAWSILDLDQPPLPVTVTVTVTVTLEIFWIARNWESGLLKTCDPLATENAPPRF